MSAGRASGALSRTRTPLEPEAEPESEPEPNHRYRVGQVAEVGGIERGREGSGSSRGEAAAEAWLRLVRRRCGH